LTWNERGGNMGFMPQMHLPIFPEGTTHINNDLAFERRHGQVTYFNGHLPVFTHEAGDVATFRMFTSQLMVNGMASQGEIVRAFGVPLGTVKRYVKRYREQGPKAFYKPAARKIGSKLTPERLVQVQAMLDEGLTVPAISEQTGVMRSTLHKAIDDGRLKAPAKKKDRRRPV
jgi:hypothetical protein